MYQKNITQWIERGLFVVPDLDNLDRLAARFASIRYFSPCQPPVTGREFGVMSNGLIVYDFSHFGRPYVFVSAYSSSGTDESIRLLHLFENVTDAERSEIHTLPEKERRELTNLRIAEDKQRRSVWC